MNSASFVACATLPQGATWTLADSGPSPAAEVASSRSRGKCRDTVCQVRRSCELQCAARRCSPAANIRYQVSERRLAKIVRHQRQQLAQSACVVPRASGDNSGADDASSTSSQDSLQSQTDLAAKLAAMESEAEALRAELARRAGKPGTERNFDLASLRPQRPEKRIDGTGLRETLLSGPGRPSTAEAPKEEKWGLSEAELFLTRGGPREGEAIVGPATEEGAEGVVRRRLIVGLGLTATAIALSFVKNPFGKVKPMKPLFLYLAPIVRLAESLKYLEGYDQGDASEFQGQLRQITTGTSTLSIRENLISAASWLDEEKDSDRATSLAFEILDFLNQADYAKYFDSRGDPTTAQLLEFSRFSMQCVTEASKKLEEFFALMPKDALSAAKVQTYVVKGPPPSPPPRSDDTHDD